MIVKEERLAAISSVMTDEMKAFKGIGGMVFNEDSEAKVFYWI